MDGEHEHRFKPIIQRDGPFGLEWIAGREDCECGRTYVQHLLDPLVNMRAAVAIARRRAASAPWRGTRYRR